MPLKQTELVLNFFMKTLKIISLISFLLICILDSTKFPIFIIMIMSLVEFLNSLFYENIGIYWEGLFTIPVIGTCVIVFLSKPHKDRYLLSLCFIVLLLSVIIYTGAYKPNNWKLFDFSFLLPVSTFILAFIFLLMKNFKN